jgi:hypothetical protein
VVLNEPDTPPTNHTTNQEDDEGEEGVGGGGDMDVYGYRDCGPGMQRKNRPGQRARRAKCVCVRMCSGW